jgi:hypothetical protein
MSSEGIGIQSGEKSHIGNDDSKEKPDILVLTTSPIPTQQNSEGHRDSTRHVYLKRDCFDFINTIVITLAFFAAVYAGSEAKRLADLTQTAVTNSTSDSARQAADTQSSLAISKQAADAATRTVEETIAVERGRLTTGGIKFVDWDGKNPNPNIALQIVNIGRTTALASGYYFACDLYPLQVHPVKVTYHIETEGNIVISPGAVYTIDQGTGCGMLDKFSSDDYTSLTKATKAIVVTGYIKFKDVFDQHWTKEFSFRSWGNGFLPDEGHNQETKDK